MSSKNIACPICHNAEGGRCAIFSNFSFECQICGYYRMDVELYEQSQARPNDGGTWRLTRVQRAVLSHRIRTNSPEKPSNQSGLFTITSDLLDSIRSNGVLPSAANQAANIVRFVGDSVSRSGDSIVELPVHYHPFIGALNRESAVRLTEELDELGILKSDGIAVFTAGPHRNIGLEEPANVNLTLVGWEQYDSQIRGNFEGKSGFIAMQFNDDQLDPFVREVVKPTVKAATGWDLVDMRDVATAGIIDNIMRMRIREARFVIADLTHDNAGAYWEAGYAEGLGKPVIYICEAEKFEREKSHFDTNHCTTIPWSRDDPETFEQQLTATLRRSLELGA